MLISKNKGKMLKKAFCLIFALIFSINSFAAVVSDNDGAAFVTKAEFEALKENFASQVEQYNTSIDSKIDGAIASYLAGVNLQKRQYLKTNIDKDGNLKNGVPLVWNSNTSSYFGDTSGERLAIETFTMYFGSTKPGYDWTTGGFQWKERSGGAMGLPTVDARKYLTSKEVKMKLDNGTTVNSQTRMKVRCNISWFWDEFQFRGDFATTTSWGPSSPARMGMNQNNYQYVFQNTRELHIADTGERDDSRWTHGPSWIAWGAITVDTHDIADDGERYTYTEWMCPLSTASEWVWDTSINNQAIQTWGNTDRRLAWTDAVNLNYRRTDAYIAKGTFSGGPLNTDGWKVPWLKQGRTVNTMYLTNLLSIDNRNRQVKNGLILCDTDKDGDYTFKVSANKVGKLYVYIGKTAISNWTSADFKGKKFDIAEADKSYEFKYDDVLDKETPIWICYLPTNVTDVATLKVEDVYYQQ